MIQAIEQRRQTMLKVMQYIVERQHDFFENGVQHLRPLTLREVGDHIEMHESTVSRVTNEKYVETPRGVFSLKYFFSSGLSTTSGTDISARGVKAKMEALISGGHPQTPHRHGPGQTPPRRRREDRPPDGGKVSRPDRHPPRAHAQASVSASPRVGHAGAPRHRRTRHRG